jgi:hypothetical protein
MTAKPVPSFVIAGLDPAISGPVTILATWYEHTKP